MPSQGRVAAQYTRRAFSPPFWRVHYSPRCPRRLALHFVQDSDDYSLGRHQNTGTSTTGHLRAHFASNVSIFTVQWMLMCVVLNGVLLMKACHNCRQGEPVQQHLLFCAFFPPHLPTVQCLLQNLCLITGLARSEAKQQQQNVPIFGIGRHDGFKG